MTGEVCRKEDFLFVFLFFFSFSLFLISMPFEHFFV